jgi:uncharacterized surface protein with fasciclin (FAS1) repeats
MKNKYYFLMLFHSFLSARLHNFKLKLFLFVSLPLLAFAFTSCQNEFEMEGTSPEWLGESIYDYLKTQGHFTCFTRIIDSLGYTEVLSKTGSKTLFVADDEAFERFFSNPDNPYGASRFEDLSKAQMGIILFSSMINNAQLIELLSNMEGPSKGRCLRRNTGFSVIDTIPYVAGNNLPGNRYWDRFRNKGLLLAVDDSNTPMVHLLPEYMKYQKISENDFCHLTNRDSLVENGAYVNGRLVIKRDITCKNGYIHQLEDVALPLQNMAELIRQESETSLFSEFIERFSAPYYSPSLSADYSRIYGKNDSIFVKRYFSEYSKAGNLLTDPEGNVVSGSLSFDPGWNGYTPSGKLYQEDMGVIFAPTNEAVLDYFNTGGKFLVERYGSIESIPDKLIDNLVNNHLKPSFINTVPSRFYAVTNDAQIEMGVEPEDIRKVHFGSNGVVYVMNKIYPPVSFVAVSAPALVNENMKIINWAIEELQFYAYLLSMDSYFSFVIPSDDALKKYIDPVSYGKNVRHCFEFKFNDQMQTVEAVVRQYDDVTGLVGDSLRAATPKEVLNRLENILDYHVVVGNIEDGKEYYLTKGGGTIKITGSGSNLKVQGGFQIEENTTSDVTRIFDQTKQGNGKAYLVEDMPLLGPIKSIYSILKDKTDFRAFYNLLAPDDSSGYIASRNINIFETKLSNIGLDLNVKFFNTYHYTVYVPTNQAIQNAIDSGLPTWEIIFSETDMEVKDSLANVLTKFLRYHFQDNSVYVDNVPVQIKKFETAAVNDSTNRFFKLNVNLSPGTISLTDNLGREVRVLSSNPENYNIMARDYLFNGKDRELVSEIETSSWAVIHQIDDVLLYDDIIPGYNPSSGK